MDRLCVIFDLDGTLVDSETLGNQAFLDLLPELTDPVETLTERYRGMKLAFIMNDLAARLGQRIPEEFESVYRSRVSVLFKESLRPIAGVPQMLSSLRHAKCIASSGPLAKIRESLNLCGLAHHFGDKVFSSYAVNSWKPDPGLFLHASHEMGFAPRECVVVEDSDVGIEAAFAAGMAAMHFVPRAGVVTRPGAIAFNCMSHLPGLLVRQAGRVDINGQGN